MSHYLEDLLKNCVKSWIAFRSGKSGVYGLTLVLLCAPVRLIIWKVSYCASFLRNEDANLGQFSAIITLKS